MKFVKNKHLVILDVETTGVKAGVDKVIELYMLKIFNDEVESLFMQTFSTYKPSKTKGKNKEKAIKPKYISEYEKSKKS